ncbi:MAG: TlpA family protein disulfide reductase [Flavobacteriales bacterium]
MKDPFWSSKGFRVSIAFCFGYILLLLLSSCSDLIVQVPSTDYEKMSKEEKEELHYPPDSTFRFTEKNYGSAEQMELYEIDKQRLFGLMDSNSTAWVAMWATWCPHCLSDLDHYCELDSLRDDMQLFLVSTNYDPRIIKEFTYRKPVFVIDAEQYGKDESQRMTAFAEKIAGKPLDSLSLPHHFFFKENEKVGHTVGEVSSDTLDSIFSTKPER